MTAVRLGGGSKRLLRAAAARPTSAPIQLLLAIVLVENASRLAIPYLVKEGIDTGIPPIRERDDLSPLLTIVAHRAGRHDRRRPSPASCSWSAPGRSARTCCSRSAAGSSGTSRCSAPRSTTRYTSGRVISRQTSDVDAIYEMLETGFDGLVTAALTLVGTAGLLLFLDVKLGLVALCCGPFLAWLTAWFRRNSAESYTVTREKVALVIVHFVESMGGIRAVQAFRREPRNQEIFDDVNDQYRRANLVAFRLVAWFMPGIRLIGNVTIAVVLLYGGYRAYNGDVTVGVLAAFLLYLRQFFEPMMEISQFYNTFQSASAALEKLAGRPRGGARRSPSRADPVPLDRARGELRFDHVGFAYVEDRPVLPDLDLTVPGRSDRWPSSAPPVPARRPSPSWPPASTTRSTGRVLLDGTDVRRLSSDDLRRNVVMVTQENYLFSGTIADNIRFGRRTPTMDEVVRATTALGAHDFIAAMPDGYETDVANQGGRLSAGQRQLVAFARAFLADPAVLILDEATSSLDVPSERLVQQALRTVLAGRTAVIIAHRLSTVEIADRVLVMEHGRIVEDGSPADLIAGGDGRYSDLHRAWVESLA